MPEKSEDCKIKLVTDKKTGVSYEMQSRWEILATVLWLALFSIIVSLSALTLHEFSHLWGSAMNGYPDCRSWFEFRYVYGFPVPVSGYAGVDGWWSLYAGGVITGVVFVAVGLWARLTKTIEDFYIEFAFLVVGASHLFYGLYEGSFSALTNHVSWDMYRVLAHVVQLSGALAIVVLTFRKLKLYLLAGGGLSLEEMEEVE